MLKITINGEGNRGQKEFNNFKDANFEIMRRCNQLNGYNKTWIKIEKDNKVICDNVRLNLNTSCYCKNLKDLLIEDAEHTLNILQRDTNKDYKTITECKRFIDIIRYMDNEGNLQSLYNYAFWFKGEKVWEYTLDELQDDRYTQTTLKILSGEEQGFGKPVPNCKKEDLIVRVKELQYAL